MSGNKETEMSIHAVDKNLKVDNVIIEYRDRPGGSESKLNTYLDGLKVIRTGYNSEKGYICKGITKNAVAAKKDVTFCRGKPC